MVKNVVSKQNEINQKQGHFQILLTYCDLEDDPDNDDIDLLLDIINDQNYEWEKNSLGHKQREEAV